MDPLDELIFTVLSQNTNDINRDRAWSSMKRNFKTWKQVEKAPKKALADSIRVGGLGDIKAGRIKEILREIKALQGKYSLDFLEKLSVDEGRDYLLSLPGVGPKTAACVLLFALGKAAFPVDTHIFRVGKRIGLIGKKTSYEEAHRVMEKLVPVKEYYPFHINLITLGRRVCKAGKPMHEVCPVKGECGYYKANKD